MRQLFISLIVLAFTSHIHAQAPRDVVPQIGRPMPNFTLTNITHFGKKEASLKDFEGKWLALDFWGTTCKTCIASFPKINELHKKFSDKMTYMLVGANSRKYAGTNIEKVYEFYREKLNLEMPSAYDSILFDGFKIGQLPHIIIVNPEGIVKYITDGSNLTADKVNDILDNKQVALYKSEGAPNFNAYVLNRPYTNVLYHSTLVKWNGETQRMPHTIESALADTKRPLTLKFSMVPLYSLYGMAYLGLVPSMMMPMDSAYYSVSQKLFVELQDPSAFDYDFCENLGRGLYNYSLTLPDAEVSKATAMKTMQEDLKRVFGYTASVEKRDIPIWYLVAKDGAFKKLKTRGGTASITGLESSTKENGLTTHYTGLKIINTPVDKILRQLTAGLAGMQAILVDKTGITGNIDITIKADLGDFEEVCAALQKNGLDLVEGKKEMLALVIRDSIAK